MPWIKQNLATTGHEQTWLIGFSKSGLGAQDLILKHPDLFTLAASWDFPADMATYDGLGSDPPPTTGPTRITRPITASPRPSWISTRRRS